MAGDRKDTLGTFATRIACWLPWHMTLAVEPCPVLAHARSRLHARLSLPRTSQLTDSTISHPAPSLVPSRISSSSRPRVTVRGVSRGPRLSLRLHPIHVSSHARYCPLNEGENPHDEEDDDRRNRPATPSACSHADHSTSAPEEQHDIQDHDPTSLAEGDSRPPV